MLTDTTIQKIIHLFNSEYTVESRIFSQQQVADDIDAYCISTNYGFFVLFQADFLSQTETSPQQLLFHLCLRKLNVLPLELVKTTRDGADKVFLTEPKNDAAMNNFALVCAALKGDEAFYKKWFDSRKD